MSPEVRFAYGRDADRTRFLAFQANTHLAVAFERQPEADLFRDLVRRTWRTTILHTPMASTMAMVRNDRMTSFSLRNFTLPFGRQGNCLFGTCSPML